MKDGFAAALQARQEQLDMCKATLEGLYMAKETEEQIAQCDQLKAKYDDAIGSSGVAANDFGSNGEICKVGCGFLN